MSVKYTQQKTNVIAARSALHESIRRNSNQPAPRNEGIKKRVIDRYNQMLREGKKPNDAKDEARKLFDKINAEEFKGSYDPILFEKWIEEENESER